MWFGTTTRSVQFAHACAVLLVHPLGYLAGIHYTMSSCEPPQNPSVSAYFWLQVYKLDPVRLYATYFGGDEAQGLAPDEEAKAVW